MAPQDKQERRLARQRGAGPRDLKNAAFNFSFGAPALPPQPSSRKTPQPRKASPQKTPAPRSSTGKRKRGTPARPPSTRSTKIASTPIAPEPTEEVDELSPDLPVPIDISELPQLRRVSIPILPLATQDHRPPPSPDRRPPREERGRSRTRKSIISVSYSQSRSRLDTLGEEEEGFTPGAPDDELELLEETATTTPLTRRASGASSTARRRTSGTGTFDGGTSAFLRNQAAQSTRREVYEIPTEDAQSEDELTPEPMKTSRRRKSEIDILPDADAEESASEDEDELSPQQDTTINDSIASLRTPLADRTTNTTRPREEQEKPDQDESTQPARKKQKTSMDNTSKPRAKGGPTIPVTIYRRTKLPDDDPLGIDPDPVPSLNAADVLSQISGEIINSYISSVPASAQRSTGSQSKPSSKKTLRYQMQALQQFRDNLTDALRTITFAQHSFYKFGGELRRAKKQKRDLREELMARRREREDLEIEIDRVRGEHLAAEREDERRRMLVEDVTAIEEAVKRGRAKTAVDHEHDEPEGTIVTEAKEVVNALGTLNRVKDFNAFLTRAAEGL